MNETHYKYSRTTILIYYTIALALMLAGYLTLTARIQSLEKQLNTIQTNSARTIIIEQTFEVTHLTKVPKVKEQYPYQDFIEKLGLQYHINPNLIRSMVYHESRFNPNENTKPDLGLMQIIPRYHSERMQKLNITDLYDPYSNLLVGVDYLAELRDQTGDMELALMMYNMNHKKAKELYKQGKLSTYATSVLALSEKYQKGE